MFSTALPSRRSPAGASAAAAVARVSARAEAASDPSMAASNSTAARRKSAGKQGEGAEYGRLGRIQQGQARPGGRCSIRATSGGVTRSAARNGRRRRGRPWRSGSPWRRRRGSRARSRRASCPARSPGWLAPRLREGGNPEWAEGALHGCAKVVAVGGADCNFAPRGCKFGQVLIRLLRFDRGQRAREGAIHHGLPPRLARTARMTLKALGAGTPFGGPRFDVRLIREARGGSAAQKGTGPAGARVRRDVLVDPRSSASSASKSASSPWR